MSVLVIAIFSVWFLISVACQVSRAFERTARPFDVLSLIPCWRFFAPVPLIHDYSLLYREELGNQVLTPWKETRFTPEYLWWHALWNPDRREKKALFDLVSEMTIIQGAYPDKPIALSVPYLLILNYLSTRPRSLPVEGIQFQIVRLSGFGSVESPITLIRSSVHRLS